MRVPKKLNREGGGENGSSIEIFKSKESKFLYYKNLQNELIKIEQDIIFSTLPVIGETDKFYFSNNNLYYWNNTEYIQLNVESTPSTIVYFDKATPTTVGVAFTPDSPATTDRLYISSINFNQYTYYGSAYHTYEAPITNNTEFVIRNTNIDAGSNKTIAIERSGSVKIQGDNPSSWALTAINDGVVSAHGLLGGISATSTGAPFQIWKGFDVLLGVTNTGQTYTKNYTLPLASPTSGKVLGYLASGVADWVDGSLSGIWGIANTSGVYTYYATITLAMAGATAGQCIDQFGDVTETGNVSVTCKTGVTINGNGHLYNYTNVAGDCFIDNGGNVDITVINFFPVRTSATATGKIWHFLGGGSYVTFIGGKSVMTVASGAFIVATFNIRRLEGYRGFAIGDGKSLYCFYSIMQVYNCYGESSGSTGYNVLMYVSYAENVTGKCLSSGPGILTTGGVYVNLNGYSSSGDGIQTASSAQLYRSYGQSSSGNGIANYGTAHACEGVSGSGHGIAQGEIVNCIGTSSTGYGIFGTVTVSGSKSKSTGNLSTLLYGGSKVTHSEIISEWNNAGGHGVNFNGTPSGIKLLHNDIIVTNTSANCIYSAAAISVKMVLNSYDGATTALNANVTNGISNTADAQGNILI